MKKNWKFLSVLFIFITLFLVSCDKDIVQNDPPVSNTSVRDGNALAYRMSYVIQYADSLGCYRFKYPLSFIVKESGKEKTLTLNNYDDFHKLIQSNTITIIDIVYPYTLIDMYNNQEVVINKEEDVEEALHNCSTYTGGSELGLEGQLMYIVENADSLGCYDFKYPFDILLKDGDGTKTKTLGSTKDFLKMLNSEYGAFVDFVYPFSLIRLSDNLEVEIKNVEDIGNAINDCYEPGGNADEDGFAFAMSYVVEYADSLGCYTYKYPLQYVLKDGEGTKIITLNSSSDFLALMKSDEVILDFVYPFTLINMYVEEETEIVINSKEDVATALHNCSTYTPGTEN